MYIFHILDNYARAERYVFQSRPWTLRFDQKQGSLTSEEKEMSLALSGRYANYAVSIERSRKNNISTIIALKKNDHCRSYNLLFRKVDKFAF